jgi:hypothetical protein
VEVAGGRGGEADARRGGTIGHGQRKRVQG